MLIVENGNNSYRMIRRMVTNETLIQKRTHLVELKRRRTHFGVKCHLTHIEVKEKGGGRERGKSNNIRRSSIKKKK